MHKQSIQEKACPIRYDSEYERKTVLCNQQELRQSPFECIEVFYNRKKLHSSLGYTSPSELMRQYQQSISMAS